MSLQLVANHLAQKGRGPDSNLVHMSNKEVAGLQALAKRHGGSLSVNPDTGLPEAGFLDSILPTIAGAGLSYFTGMSPMMAAGLVGGIKALDSKDLSQGLMAGLGAYGGAGLTAGLMTAGTGALTQQGIEAAGGAEALGAVPGGATGIAENVAGASNFDRLSAGAGQLFSNPGQAMQAIGDGSGYKAAGILGAAAAPMLADEMVETTTEAPEQSRGMIRPYTYSRQQVPQDYQGQQGNMGSKERRYFNEGYTAGDPYAAANGGLVALAGGGDMRRRRGYEQQSLFTPTTPLPANNMYGASRDAYDYLMGVNTPSGGQPYDPIRDIRIDDGSNLNPNTPKTGTGKYEFDPVTKQYKWVPDPIAPVDATLPVFENPAQRGGGGGQGRPVDHNPEWTGKTDAEKTEYYAQHPFESGLASGAANYLSNGFLFGALGKAQDYFNPGFTERNMNILRGIHPPADSPLAGGPLDYDVQARKDETDAANAAYAASRLDSGAVDNGGYADSARYAGTSFAPASASRLDSGAVTTAFSPYGLNYQKPEAATNKFNLGTLTPNSLNYAGTGVSDTLNMPTVPEATPTGTYYDNSMAGDKGFAATGGFGNTWRSADGTPIRTADGSALQTGQGAAQESSNDKVNRIVREAQIAAGSGTFMGGDTEGTQAAAAAAAAQAQADREQAGREAARQAESQAQQAEAAREAQTRQEAAERAQSERERAERSAPAPAPPSNDNYSNEGRNSGGGGGEGRNGPEGRGDPGGDRGGWGRGGGYAKGGLSAMPNPYDLGSYSDGGRLLKGPGDGVSDDIPATIGHGQPARLADGEFVIPARIVSEIGNGSTDAGARELYKMMDRIQAGRKKTVGKDQVAKNSKAVRHLPA